MNLFNITQEAMLIDSLMERHAEAHEGDISDVCTTLDEWVAENQISLAAKLEAIGGLVRDRSARAEARETEAKRLSEEARKDEAFVERLKDWCKRCMESSNMTKAQGGIYAFSIVKSGARSLVLDIPENEVPDEFIRVEKEIDKMKIKDAVIAGETTIGHLAEPTTSLRIK